MPLKILVSAKRVEDPESRIRVRPDGTGIVTEGMNYRMNPFDEIAVEEALRLREKHGGEVVAVGIGGEPALAELRAALAMGADRALLVRHDGPLDPPAVSALLAAVFAKEQPDLALLGKQSIDDDQNQVGQYLAERLGLRAAGELEQQLEAAGLEVVGGLEAAPRHPRSQDRDDPLHEARSQEVTALRRLRALDRPAQQG